MTGDSKIPDNEFSFKDVGDVLRSIRPRDGAGPESSAGEPTERAAAEPKASHDDSRPRGKPKPRRRATDKQHKSKDAGERKTERRKFKKPKGLSTRLQSAAAANHSSSPRRLVEEWLAVMVKAEASDLILRSGGRPSLRVGGKIEFLPGRVPGPGPMLEVFKGILGPKRLEEWNETGSADAAIQLDGLGRFRINAYKQLGEPAIVIRRIGDLAPKLEDLNLPTDELKELAMRKRGLVLVTGIAGSGKSTSLAGMIEYMNQTVERHIVTLEDPVELIFQEKNCVISQREVGTDTTSFSDGLRHAMRQSPDVILIGEVRDATTVVAALDATETGHMVMSTMHTVNAAQTVERILGFFPVERHKQIRQRLADNLAGVLSQRLVPARKGGLVPAFELMITTPHIRELIEEGETSEMARVIEAGSEAGLISFNECLRGLVESQQIELKDALATSDKPDELLLTLRGIRGSSDRVSGPPPGKGPGPGPRNGPRRDSGDGDGLRLAGS